MRVIKITIDADTGERVYQRSEVAKEAGVTTQTIRHWEEAGLIPPPVRDEKNNFRYWSEEDLEEIKAFVAENKQKQRYGKVNVKYKKEEG